MHIDDPSGLIEAAEKKSQGFLFMAVPALGPYRQPAHIMDKRPASRDYAVTVPFDTDLKLRIYNMGLAMQDASGNVLKGSVIEIPVRVSSKDKNQPLVLTVVGAQ